MEDWDDLDKDDAEMDAEIRSRELNRVEQKFKSLGIENGLNAIAGQENAQVQASFDKGFVQTLKPSYRVANAYGRLKSLQHIKKFLPASTLAVDPNKEAELHNQYVALMRQKERSPSEEEAFIRECDQLFLAMTQQGSQ